jgi:hypothetical protein
MRKTDEPGHKENTPTPVDLSIKLSIFLAVLSGKKVFIH